MRYTSRTLPLAAIAFAAIGLGVSSTAGDGPTVAPKTEPQASAKATGPLACALDISSGLFGLTFSGQAEALRDVSGTYDLTIEKNGRSGSAVIRQGGEFRLRAGQTDTLGEATLSGDPSEFDARLTVKVGGQRFTCRPTGSIDL